MWQPIETAPKGEMKAVKVGDKGGEKTIHVPHLVLALTSDDNVVMTYWDAFRGKWSMFTKSCPPTHWWDFGGGLNMPEPPK